jgi:VanZ family protein
MRQISPVRRLCQALFFGAATVAFIMACLPQPPGVPFEPSDKIQHVVAFAVLALLARVAFWEARALSIFVSLSLFGALIECVQLVPALGRDADIVDWLADNVAVLAVLMTAKAWHYWANKVQQA